MSSRRKVTARERRRRREDLLRLQGGKCFWCSEDVEPECVTIDELLPRSRGGSQCWTNIVASCAPCNWGRGDFVAPAWAFVKVAEREAQRTQFPPAINRLVPQ